MNFSIVIPFRNEKENLSALIDTLVKQKTRSDYEIIFVDDFSNDGGEKIIKNYNYYSNSNLIKLISRKGFPQNFNISSKQNALDLGAEFAKYDFLVFTDADMTFDENWLENYRISIEKDNAEFMFGRTEIRCAYSLVDVVQKAQLDFLFAAAWLFCKIGLDTSCMGNNIAISKKLYNEIGGQKAIGFSITEDRKLLSEVKKRKIPIFCVKNFPADAFTKPVGAKVFLHQMLRWIKGAMVESRFLTTVLLIFAIGNLLIIPSIVVVLFIIPICLKNKIDIKYFFILPFAFFVETIILLPSLFFVELEWKERKIF
jgi:glycosyltransferase involved in cell wall biosynthesis